MRSPCSCGPALSANCPGVGARTAATLTEYCLHTVADVPAVTLQRLLGARLGRTLHERAHGRDTSVVDLTPGAGEHQHRAPLPSRRTRSCRAPARPGR